MVARLSELNQVLFPVEMAPVYIELPSGTFQRVPGKRAVVNTQTGNAVSVVGDQYQLVTNSQALHYGRLCCEAAFPQTNASEWTVNTVDGPSTGGHCMIDLLHSTTFFNPFGGNPDVEGEVYAPFVRVTNSYNGTRALRLYFGFLRERCSNGLIVAKEATVIDFDHNSRDIDQRIRNRLNEDLSLQLRSQFTSFVRNLREHAVPRQLFNPIMRSALKLNEPKVYKRSTAAAWVGIDASLEAVSHKYARTLGANGYGLLNALTDFATNPPQNHIVRRDRHGFQSLAGKWLSGFSEECKKESFDAERYVAGLNDPAKNAAPANREHGWPTRQAA